MVVVARCGDDDRFLAYGDLVTYGRWFDWFLDPGGRVRRGYRVELCVEVAGAGARGDREHVVAGEKVRLDARVAAAFGLDVPDALHVVLGDLLEARGVLVLEDHPSRRRGRDTESEAVRELFDEVLRDLGGGGGVHPDEEWEAEISADLEEVEERVAEPVAVLRVAAVEVPAGLVEDDPVYGLAALYSVLFGTFEAGEDAGVGVEEAVAGRLEGGGGPFGVRVGDEGDAGRVLPGGVVGAAYRVDDRRLAVGVEDAVRDEVVQGDGLAAAGRAGDEDVTVPERAEGDGFVVVVDADGERVPDAAG